MKKKSLSKYLKLTVLTIAISSLFLVGCGTSNEGTSVNDGGTNNEVVSDEEVKPDEEVKDDVVISEELPMVTIVVKDMGTIKAELYPEIAPNTVKNFIELSNEGFYNGLTFHRVIKDFMIQGGDPNGNGTGGPGYSIKGEFGNNGFTNNLKHTEGVLSMARAGNPNSAGSQFFIMTKEAPHLDNEYAAFGKVIEGMDVVHKIETVEVNGDKPVQIIEIESIEVDTKGKTYGEAEKIAE